MKTSLERVDATTVKLLVEVEPERVTAAFQEAAQHLAADITLPGFRKGKVPRRLLEQRIGRDAIMRHAVEDHLGTFYSEAIGEHDVRPVAPPEIDLQTFTEAEGCTFEATVAVRPDIELPDHTGIDVTFPEWDATDAEVEEQLAELRDRFAELEEVERPAGVGDFVTIDLHVKAGGVPLEDATAEDALYEVGSGGVTPRLDEELPGAAAGHILSYSDTLPADYPQHGGEEVQFRVLVKDVRAKRLPALDDDFAAMASEFDTVDDLRADLRRSLRRRKLGLARQELRGRVVEAFVATVDVPLPEKMVQAEVEGRLEMMARQAAQYGMDLEQLLSLQGTDLDSYRGRLDEQARLAVKAQLVLEELAEREQVSVESADLEQEILRHALQRGVDPREIARVVSEQGTAHVLIGDVVRRKAIDLLVDAADVAGAPPPDVLEELERAQDELDGPEPLDLDLGAAPPEPGDTGPVGEGEEPAPAL